jgi:hypothetical protein
MTVLLQNYDFYFLKQMSADNTHVNYALANY